MDLETNNQTPIPNKDTQINLVLTPDANQGTTVDLVNVFHNMKIRKRFFAWVLLFCMLLGISASLLAAQFMQPQMTVSSIMTFDYDIDYDALAETDPELVPKDEKGLNIKGVQHVFDLTAPDGQPLDLGQITSPYVLQQAIDMTGLSTPITASSLSRNIRIERNMTEESKRSMEVAAQMVTDKNASAYNTINSLKQTYENKVIVSLTNGFTNGDDDKKKIMLRDDELAPLLNNILNIYNDYLVLSFADRKLPVNAFEVININKLDYLESLDLARTGLQDLYDYCNKQSEDFKGYRSPATGYSLTDLMELLMSIKSTNVDYLYSYVYSSGLAKDFDTMLASYEFQVRMARNKLNAVQDDITATQNVLDVYKNDEVYVSMQDSDTSRSSRYTTDYYNELVLQQADNYAKLAELQTTVTDLENKISHLKGKQEAGLQEGIQGELEAAMESCKGIYQMVNDHMEEVFATAESQTYAQRSAAYGKSDSFLAAGAKYMIIGAVAGAVLACGLWFMSALIQEMKRGKKFEDEGTEVND